MWSNHLKMFTVFNSLLAHLQRSKNPQTHNCSTLIMLKSLDLVPSPPNHAIFFSDTLPMTTYFSWSSFVTKWPTIQNIYSKLYSTTCANTYREGTTSEVNRIIVIRNGKFLEGNLDRVFAATLEFPKILVPRLPQHTSNINIEWAGKSKHLYSLCDQLLGALILLFWNYLFLIDDAWCKLYMVAPLREQLYRSLALEEKYCCSYYSRQGDK